jgi:hypothetical protein
VLVLEQHRVAGGLTHTFSREGWTWGVGVHYLGDMGQEDEAEGLLEWISDGTIHMASMGPVYDAIHFPDGFVTHFARPEEALRRELKAKFPDSISEIDAWFDALHAAQSAGHAVFALRAMAEPMASLYRIWKSESINRWCGRTTREVLTQLIKPGAKVVLKPDTDVFDMTTTQCTYGSPEQNLGKVAMAQLARFYNIPIYSLGGGVEGKVPDAETASEAMMSMLLNGLAGATLNQSLGSMAFGMYGSPEMAVICDEQVSMIKRILDGIAVTDDTLAEDVIRQIGPGGEYLGHDHTVQYFRKELYYPRLFRRQTIDEWVQGGKKMAHQAAHEKVQQILAKSGPVPLAEGADAELERALQRACSAAD